MKYKIIQDIQFLHKKSEQATEEEAKQIIADLEDTLADYPNGCGLSAPQIGILKQVAIVRLPKMKIDIVNPIILEKGNPFRNEKEGCLSLAGLYVDTRRYWNYSFVSQGILYTLDSIPAIACQHEYNHLQGKLITDKSVIWRNIK